MKKRYSSSRVEWDYIGQLLDAIENQNIRNQVGNALKWYVIKANRYRLIEHCLNTLTLIIPTVLMILNKCMPEECIAGQVVVAVLGTFAAAAKSFSKLHDKRIRYRRAAEFIKSETIRYINRVDVYREKDRNEIFVINIDGIRLEENNSWIEIENEKETISTENNNSVSIKPKKDNEETIKQDI